jgi:hypothetical protein
VIRPNADDVLASVIDTFDRYIAPEVRDEYAASLCLTVSQLLRSVRVRVAEEGQALHDDNEELRRLLVGLRDDMSPPVRTQVDEVLGAPTPEAYVPVARLQADAVSLRGVLVACIDDLPDRVHPGRQAIRTYLAHQLERQQPWLVDAFTGRRR